MTAGERLRLTLVVAAIGAGVFWLAARLVGF